MMPYPKRTTTHIAEQQSEIFFRSRLPKAWIVSKPDKDYGVDLSLEIPEGGYMKGLELLVQLKSSEESNQLNNFERVTLAISTYRYLWNKLQVVLLVKYVKADEEAYWILLKDIVAPGNEKQQSFTVYIPRVNRLSAIHLGNNIVSYVRNITNRKIKAVRPTKTKLIHNENCRNTK